METAATFLTAILCFSGPLFFITSVALSILLYAQLKKNKALEKNGKENIENVQQSFQYQKQSLELMIQEQEKRINILSINAVADFCLKWCQEIVDASYSSEVEVEIKFIYPFMRFLGYNMHDLFTRVPVEVPVGRQKVSAIADWVVYNHQRKPFLVIEAKESKQQLNVTVQDQARSYAFALNAPLYMLTNGKDIVLFERKIEQDECILNLNVRDFPHQWKSIEQIIGKK